MNEPTADSPSRMNHPVVRAYVIGQTPRPDLTQDLEHRFPSVSFEVVGALDGVGAGAIETCAGCAYPLETRLRDGTRVVIDASYVEEGIQSALNAYGGDASAHLLLCAGPFPHLTVPAPESDRRAPLIRPFEVAAHKLRALGHTRLEVVVPFPEQAGPALEKWTAEGFDGHTHVLSERPAEVPLPDWLSGRLPGGGADALVFDYVGFPAEALRDIAALVDIPVFDLGHVALDALQELLDMRSDP